MKSRLDQILNKLTETHFEFASRLRFLRLFGLKVYLNLSGLGIIGILDELSKDLSDNLAKI